MVPQRKRLVSPMAGLTCVPIEVHRSEKEEDNTPVSSSDFKNL